MERGVNYVFCSQKISGEIENSLFKLGVIPVKLELAVSENDEVNFHTDMLCFNLEEKKWLFYDDIYKANREKIDALNLKIITTERKGMEYPFNIALNAAKADSKIFCNRKYTDKHIIENADFKILNVKQGYAKCSVCVVNDNAIITADRKIHETALENNIDSLLINCGEINLHGYEYGFIGGCSGLITENKLAFTGDIAKHSSYGSIKKFCCDRNVEIICLSREKLYDYGGLLRIT